MQAHNEKTFKLFSTLPELTKFHKFDSDPPISNDVYVCNLNVMYTCEY